MHFMSNSEQKSLFICYLNCGGVHEWRAMFIGDMLVSLEFSPKCFFILIFLGFLFICMQMILHFALCSYTTTHSLPGYFAHSSTVQSFNLFYNLIFLFHKHKRRERYMYIIISSWHE